MKMINSFFSNYLLKFKKFKKFLGKEVWVLFLVSIFFGIILFLTESAFILVLQGFLGAIGLVEGKQLILPDWYPRSLLASVCILLGFGLLRSFALMMKSYLGATTGQAFIRLQRSRALEYGFSFTDQISTSKVVTIFTERISQAGGVLQTLSQLVLVITCLLLFFVMGFKIAPIEMLIGITLLAVFMLPLKKLNEVIHKSGEGLRLEWGGVNEILLQGLRNHFFLKVYGLIPMEIRKGKESLKRYETHFRTYFKVASFKTAYPNMVGILVISLITYISIQKIHTQGIVLISFFYLFIRMAQGASETNAAIGELRLHFNAFKEIFHWHQILEMSSNMPSRIMSYEVDEGQSLFKDGISIQVNNLTFSYNNNENLFENVNLHFGKGDVLLIKGPSGVGKSTLLLLLLGFLKPTKGEVLINSNQMSEMQPYLLSNIGYVGPEPFIMVGTIRENLKFGNLYPQQLSDKDMENALSIAQIDSSMIGLDYHLGEQATLSTGQKQRIALARALLRKPRLLILDEATANLDNKTETNFISSINELLGNITVVVISHKPSFDEIATCILDLEVH